MIDDDACEAQTLANVRGASSALTKSFTITVVDGPDTGAASGIDAAAPNPLYIGTSQASELRLTDRRVSRRHVALDVVDGALRIRDLDSTNGTWIGATRVREALVGAESELTLGDTRVMVSPYLSRARATEPQHGFGSTLGDSPVMRRLYPLCERLAQSDVAVLVEGETGTGKEVLAESIHARSRRASAPFVVCDCTTIAANLAESTLFGHEKGAFTGATATQRGIFEQADHGTLLLDEIGDLTLELQAKLLRAIERQEIRRVGGDRWTKVDVRLIAATRRDLEREIEERRFRDDLFYRLAIARIELPPLRERRGDIEVLARHFWRQFGGAGELPHALLERELLTHAWPGNVRELRNAVARRVALGDLASAGRQRESPAAKTASSSVNGDDYAARVLDRDLPLTESRALVVVEFERRYLERALVRANGDATKAAQDAGIARRYFQLLRSRRIG
jgi:transcriptional regulator with GAF, ATPase, and Fis domain